jgi:GTP-binding protein HflX
MNQSFDRRSKQRDASEATRRERAVAVALALPESRITVYDHLDELMRLADTAGVDVVDQVIQQRERPDAACWIGKGKAEQLKAVADELDADLILVDDDLSPAQARNLEKLSGRRVIDRSGLILDIFASRAQTREARTQVELAQLQYLLPRLTGAWTHLERQRGGIGLRGPGETQLETDRRMVRTRIRALKLELERINRARDTRNRSRANCFKVALVGYTNAGKSTLLNRLTGARVLEEDRLFATLDPTVRRLELEHGVECVISDTVGFIRKLPHHLVASFRSTLQEVADADLLLLVADLSHPQMDAHIKTVKEVLADLGAEDRPVLHVFNKVDLVEDPARAAVAQRNWEPSIVVSATEEIRLEDLLEQVGELSRSGHGRIRLFVPWSSFDLVSRLRREFQVIEGEDEEDGKLLLISGSGHDLEARLRPFLAAGAVIR